MPNLTASRVSNRLDLQGPAYTIDAACASSLVAVDHACREIASGRCDMMLAGGVHLTQDPTFWAVFTQLGALSRSGTSRPFDRRADGILIGEGCGILLLKDGRAAERDRDQVYARIRGIGVSSDGRSASLFNPRVAGQVRSVEAAWREAARDPSRVQLVEAHGTGTPAGDAAELATLAQVFGPARNDEPRAGLGSVKSMIGHAMPAAGAAGLIKAVLSLHHGVLPPSLHCAEPHPALGQTRFRVIHREEPWPDDVGRRLAAVSAFGFGGINAHVVLEVEGAPKPRRQTPPLAKEAARVIALAADSPQGLLHALEVGIPRGGDGACRLSIVDPTPERISKARRIVENGAPWHGRHGIWFSPSALARSGGRVAFLFPGVEARFEPDVDSVATRFGLPAPAPMRPRDLEETGRGVVSLSMFLHKVLGELGVAPHVIAGHSIGEWSGLLASGILSEEDGWRLIDSLRPGSLEVPGVLFAAAGCGVETAMETVAGIPEIALSHDNCPHQVILCGRAEGIEAARARLVARGVLCQVLPFRSGFHSPLFAPFLEVHRAHFRSLSMRAARTPLWSATTCAPYPEDGGAIQDLSLDHLVKPIRFRELLLRLHDEGVRVFVQVGQGSLSGFVEDTLKGRPHVAVSASEAGRSGLAQLRNVALALFTEAVPVDLDRLAPPTSQSGVVRLDLSGRLVHLEPDLAVGQARGGGPRDEGPHAAVLRQFEETMAAVNRSQEEVLRVYERSMRPETFETERRLSVVTVPALRDHSFVPQPAGWPSVADGYPVVPMTMTIEMLLDLGRKLSPGQVAVGLQDLEALRWIMVEPEIEARLKARRLSPREIETEIEDYARARVLVSPAYREPPPPDARPLRGARPAPVDASELYTDRWMFHGPRYQGVVEIDELADDGVRGTIVVTEGPGALLDNAGQLFGYWVMATQELDRLAMPVGIQRMILYGPHPEQGDRLRCVVRITKAEELEVQADMELVRDGRIWARIFGWTDLRFASDDRMWRVMRHPEKSVLSEAREGYVWYDGGAQRAPSRDWLMRRYLGEAERKAMFESGPRRQRHYLNGRIAAKDAVRQLLWATGHGPLFPVEVRLYYDDRGRPRVEGFSHRDLRVSLAHTGDVAVAMAAEGHEVGIDIERVEDRPGGFDELAFDPREREMIETLAEGDRERLNEWRTRVWCAKEALAKARGTGLHGTPARLVVERRAGEGFWIDGTWVQTRREGAYVVAFTSGERHA
ncbi:MAG: beta-ketoacyl synthase N-terminal-like domain-containing protein [Acidobacteriota bacterium]